jgi:hypothetical protein
MQANIKFPVKSQAKRAIRLTRNGTTSTRPGTIGFPHAEATIPHVPRTSSSEVLQRNSSLFLGYRLRNPCGSLERSLVRRISINAPVIGKRLDGYREIKIGSRVRVLKNPIPCTGGTGRRRTDKIGSAWWCHCSGDQMATRN